VVTLKPDEKLALTEAVGSLHEMFTESFGVRKIRGIDRDLRARVDGDHLFDLCAYPEFDFEIRNAELATLFDAEYCAPSWDDVSSAFKQPAKSPITQLLYSVLWKGGHLPKIHNIVSGIDDAKNDRPIRSGRNSDPWVFYQFGRHLADPLEPIVDQHTIRAYRHIECGDSYAVASEALVTRENLVGYREWFFHRKIIGNRKRVQRELDQLLFSVGKAIKARGA